MSEQRDNVIPPERSRRDMERVKREKVPEPGGKVLEFIPA